MIAAADTYIAAALYERTATLPCRLIKLDGEPYMERYFLGAARKHYSYLHRFVRADSERHLHDHPWKGATSAVLCGRYSEERLTLADAMAGQSPEIALVTRCNVLTRSPVNAQVDLHRITSVQPETWTLFTHGEWEFPWGFYEFAQVQTDHGPSTSVTYREYEPRPTDPTLKHWWHDAPLGCEIGREPLLL